MSRKVTLKNKQSHPYAGGRFRIDVVDLEVRNARGETMPMTRICFERGDSVAVLVHQTKRDEVILTEQFRYPVIANADDAATNPDRAWIVEVPAGILERDEAPETCARREVEEEVGYRLDSLSPIGTFFVSPGGTSEKIYLYYAQVTGDPPGRGGGLASESEDIQVVRLPKQEFLRRAATGALCDAKTLIAALWLKSR